MVTPFEKDLIQSRGSFHSLPEEKLSGSLKSLSLSVSLTQSQKSPTNAPRNATSGLSGSMHSNKSKSDSHLKCEQSSSMSEHLWLEEAEKLQIESSCTNISNNDWNAENNSSSSSFCFQRPKNHHKINSQVTFYLQISSLWFYLSVF